MSPSYVLKKAQALAMRWHRGERRRGGKPYVSHLRDVAERVKKDGGDEIAQALAWLHDIIENTGMTEEGLRERGFPEELIADVVCISRGAEDYDTYIAGALKRPRVRFVKYHDMCGNLAGQPTAEARAKYAKTLPLLAA